MNIIGDVEGQFESLMELVKKMPTDPEGFVFVGDLIDRGPDSMKVVEWVKNNARAVMGNHEHILLDYDDGAKLYGKRPDGRGFDYKSDMIGGSATLESYKDNPEKFQEHMEWMKGLPKFIETDDHVVTHAPISERAQDMEMQEYVEHGSSKGESLMWNRDNNDHALRDKVQIHGHNKKIRVDTESLVFCIDNSSNNSVNGYSTIENKMYHAPFKTRTHGGDFSDKELDAVNEQITPKIKEFLNKKKMAAYRTYITKRAKQ